jgi:hypothetical protein
MTRFITELDKRPEMTVKDAATGRLGKRLVSLFTTSKPSSTQVNQKIDSCFLIVE